MPVNCRPVIRPSTKPLTDPVSPNLVTEVRGAHHVRKFQERLLQQAEVEARAMNFVAREMPDYSYSTEVSRVVVFCSEAVVH